MSEQELKPCPFCGHVGLSFEDGSTYRWGLASCAACGATAGEVRRNYPPDEAWHKDAIAQWNTRAALQQQATQATAVKADLLHKLRAHIVWLAFGECRSPGWEGPPPTAREAVDAIDAALSKPPVQHKEGA